MTVTWFGLAGCHVWMQVMDTEKVWREKDKSFWNEMP